LGGYFLCIFSSLLQYSNNSLNYDKINIQKDGELYGMFSSLGEKFDVTTTIEYIYRINVFYYKIMQKKILNVYLLLHTILHL
jgi:hypothetical protein